MIQASFSYDLLFLFQIGNIEFTFLVWLLDQQKQNIKKKNYGFGLTVKNGNTPAFAS